MSVLQKLIKPCRIERVSSFEPRTIDGRSTITIKAENTFTANKDKNNDTAFPETILNRSCQYVGRSFVSADH